MFEASQSAFHRVRRSNLWIGVVAMLVAGGEPFVSGQTASSYQEPIYQEPIFQEPSAPAVPTPETDGSSTDALAQEASWEWTRLENISSQLTSSAGSRLLSEAELSQLDTIWAGVSTTSGESELLGRTLESITLIHPETAAWSGPYLLDQPLLSGDLVAALAATPWDDWTKAQLQASLGVVAIRRGLYDEGLQLLDPLEANQVVDPAQLLFHRAIARQQLVRRDDALADLRRMLERAEELPRRHREVGQLMIADLEALEPDSLDEIARLMNDIRRRQQLYRSGSQVLNQEEDVIEKLDKMIEELEQQQQQQQAAAGSNFAPSSPAQNSSLKGGSAPGEVDRRAQGSGEDWGNLPSRERAAAMAELSKQLPSHYRELIEEYFRKLADESESGTRD